MRPRSTFLGIAGAAIAGPAFIMNAITHGGKMPGPNDVDRLEGAWSLAFIVGAALVLAGIFAAARSPLGRKARNLLYVEAALVAAAAAWAVVLIIDPAMVEDPNPAVAVADAGWPLHQAFMLVVGIFAARAKLWPSPARYTLFGPAIGLSLLAAGAIAGVDYIAAAGIGSGWVITGLGLASLSRRPNPQGTLVSRPLPSA